MSTIEQLLDKQLSKLAAQVAINEILPLRQEVAELKQENDLMKAALNAQTITIKRLTEQMQKVEMWISEANRLIPR